MSDEVQDMVIRAVGLSKEYDLKTHKVLALRDATFEVKRGESIAIKGPSGSGKTTLLTMIGLLDSPTSGSLIIDGVDLTQIHESKLHEVRQKKIDRGAILWRGFTQGPAEILRRHVAADGLHRA